MCIILEKSSKMYAYHATYLLVVKFVIIFFQKNDATSWWKINCWNEIESKLERYRCGYVFYKQWNDIWSGHERTGSMNRASIC